MVEQTAISLRTKQKISRVIFEMGCIPFDDMPFASNLIKHMPNMSEVYGGISVKEREHEFNHQSQMSRNSRYLTLLENNVIQNYILTLFKMTTNR